MTIKINHVLSITAFISGVLLSILIPGGPIENRDFSHISPLILMSFNLYLTVVGISSYIAAILLWKSRQYNKIISISLGISFFIIYILDLLAIFPKTESAMPIALFWIEVSGLILSAPLIWLPIIMPHESPSTNQPEHTNATKTLIALIFIIGFVIVGFATHAAMQPHNM